MKNNKLIGILLIVVCFNFLSCTKEDEPALEQTDNGSWTITISAFSFNNGTYNALGNELIFNSHQECQTWSRTAQGDSHNSESHLHYNAASNVSYDNNSISFSWTEYGPEIEQSAIESTCLNGVNGVSKTVNNSSFYQDKPNVYLKITTVVKN